jgi:nucleolar GTP-binding protein
MLLEYRVSRKLRSKRIDDVINRIHVAQPVKRDEKVRSTSIPASVLEMKAKKKAGITIEKRRTEKDLEAEGGGPGIYDCNLRKFFDLKEAEWKNDVIPEIIDGKNIADFVDPDIEERLAALEREEEELAQRYADGHNMDDDSDELDEEQKAMVSKIREKRKIIVAKRKTERSQNHPHLPRTARRVEMKDVDKNLAEIGLDSAKVRVRSKSRGRKRRADDDVDMDDDDGDDDAPRRGRSKTKRSDSKARSTSRARSQSRPRDASAYRSPKDKEKAEALGKKQQNKKFKKMPKKGEGDRTILTEKPRHLFSGKRGIGTNDRR